MNKDMAEKYEMLLGLRDERIAALEAENRALRKQAEAMVRAFEEICKTKHTISYAREYIAKPTLAAYRAKTGEGK